MKKKSPSSEPSQPKADLKKEKYQGRNPYLVLGLSPHFETHEWEEMEDLKKRSTYKKTPPVEKTVQITSWVDFPHIRKVELDLKRLESESEPDPFGKRAKHIEQKRDYLRCLKEAEELRVNLQQLDDEEARILSSALDLMKTELGIPVAEEKDPVEFRSGPEEDRETHWYARSIVHPCLYDLRQELKALQVQVRDRQTAQQVAEANPKKSPRKKKKPTEPAAQPVNEDLLSEIQASLDTSAHLQEKRASLSRYLDQVMALVNAERRIEQFQNKLKSQYHLLVNRYHPDKAGADNADALRRFHEIRMAYECLVEATPQTREKFAYDLVFACDTDGWTQDMKKAAKDVVRKVAELFSLQSPPPDDAIPCETCQGHGSLSFQEKKDFFPVPRGCLDCSGEGYILPRQEKVRADIQHVINKMPGKKKKS